MLGTDPKASGAAGRAWRSRIGLILQSTSLDSQLTVTEALMLFGSLYADSRRVDLGIAIIGQPQMLFLDEPTTGLDPEASRRLYGKVVADATPEALRAMGGLPVIRYRLPATAPGLPAPLAGHLDRGELTLPSADVTAVLSCSPGGRGRTRWTSPPWRWGHRAWRTPICPSPARRPARKKEH